MSTKPSEPESEVPDLLPAPPLVNPPAAGRRLSGELQRLIGAFSERAVCLREVLEVTHGRGFNLLLLLLAFPFCTPIPLPGVSTPFGLVIAFIGLRLALGQKPWLPARLLDKQLPSRFFPRFLAATRRLVRGLEYFLKPRFIQLMAWRLVRRSMGLIIFCSGLLLLLPLPIPFSNFLPAMTIVLLAAAMLEDDGGVAMAGGGVFILTLAFFSLIFWGGTEVVDWLEERFGGILDPDYEQPAVP